MRWRSHPVAVGADYNLLWWPDEGGDTGRINTGIIRAWAAADPWLPRRHGIAFTMMSMSVSAMVVVAKWARRSGWACFRHLGDSRIHDASIAGAYLVPGSGGRRSCGSGLRRKDKSGR